MKLDLTKFVTENQKMNFEKINTNNIKKSNINKNVKWIKSSSISNYNETISFMENLAISIANKEKKEHVWLVEHTPLYTIGTSGSEKDIFDKKFPIFKTGRGGQVTYHGPGQRTVYVMLDLQKRNFGIRDFIFYIEQWIIDTLANIDIIGFRKENLTGVWIKNNGKEFKIAAIGIRIKKWISYFGFSINISNDLSHYNHIVPCGISENKLGVTSLKELGINLNLEKLDKLIIKNFYKNN